MTASEPFPQNLHPTSAADAAELELQQELREMFEVDTQQYLQDYFSLVPHLNPQSWTSDIQNIYRAIHTIKGGAVTVEADAMLHAGMALEDLLSDLRYLDLAPDLSDGQLSQMLLEAGELLSSSIEIKATGAVAIAQVQPTVQRIQALHELIRQRYLPDWNELKQVHQEFAEQGFDLVVLELEMTLSQLHPQHNIPSAILQTAQQTLDQLIQIGQDLEFSKSWAPLIARCQALIDRADSAQWKRCWPQYFPILKDCAKQGGELSSALIAQLQAIENEEANVSSDFSDIALENEAIESQASILNTFPEAEWLTEFDLADIAIDVPIGVQSFALEVGDENEIEASNSGDLSGWLDELNLENFAEDLTLETIEPDALRLEHSIDDVVEALSSFDAIEVNPPTADALESFVDPAEAFDFSLEALQSWDVDADAWDGAIADLSDLSIPDALEETESFLLSEAEQIEAVDNWVASIATQIELSVQSTPQIQAAAKVEPEIAAPDTTAEAKRSIQISVPLERLDRSAQEVIETLVTARGVMNISQKLQTQLVQITSLTQESAQFVTRLRQLQDDYALMRNLSDDGDSSQNVNLERYRQGYTTINRLLENILRMSELGQEIETVTQQTSGRLDKLDRSILRLKDGIETSRLVPFRNLSLRAKAIVRDLSNRYGKPVELVVQGEQVELDAGILQQLEPALLHLLRNAYDHGLESVETRLSCGKPAQGHLQLSLHRRGNLYRLVLQDDGGGIDARAIARMAQEKNCTLHQTRTTAELLAVLCQPGFSSRSAVTEISGRGVGMDVVASQIAALNGKLNLETNLGKGTTFTIEVPAPQLLVPCVLVEVGDSLGQGVRTIALPTDEIVETILIDPSQISSLVSDNPLLTWTLQTNRGNAAGFDLAHYWNAAALSSGQSVARPLSDTAIAIRTRSRDSLGFGTDIWLIADDLVGQEELLINPLPSPLVAPAGLLGVSLQPDGRLISILDPMALIAAIETLPTTKEVTPALEVPASATTQQSSTLRILVVDDAALMRRRLESSLTTYGFTTFTCSDGLEAWNWLQTNERPDLMITDVEMPNMDGFTLIDRCRQTGLDLPILVVSSRLAEEWGREAKRLGASDFINKGFSTSELISKVNQLLSAPVSAPS
jgi:chemotaxis protein histidine kinase CheA/ActR/RegA family two-component response regulator